MTSVKNMKMAEASNDQSASKRAAELLVSMTGKASSAKAAEGDAPVFAYIASLPQPQPASLSALMNWQYVPCPTSDARCGSLRLSLMGDMVHSSLSLVKWGTAYYGAADGWCFSSGAYVGQVKLIFIRGTELRPQPPVMPTGMGTQRAAW